MAIRYFPNVYPRRRMHSLILAWASYLLAALLPARQAEVPFYNEEIEVTYRPELFANGPFEVSELGVDYYYAEVTKKDWLPVHAQLQAARARLGLNDWLYAKLVDEAVDAIAPFAAANERRVMALHLLTLAGYDVRLCYGATEVFVYARTDDAVFEVPMVSLDAGRYVNLTAALASTEYHPRRLNMHPLRPLPSGAGMRFALETLPRLRPDVRERTFRFRYAGRSIAIDALTDRTIAAYMHEYPFFDEGRYLEVALSPETRARLLAQLRPHLDTLGERAALEFLAAFTRGAFDYKEDKASFGYSKPMIPDEVLYYPVSDCEDRSALYFTLVRELLDVPIIAIAYDDHLSVAVASETLRGGAPLRHRGRDYYVCDPTGPKRSQEIGNPPAGYLGRAYEVVAEHDPAAGPAALAANGTPNGDRGSGSRRAIAQATPPGVIRANF